MKSYYSEYAQHCIRFFFSTSHPASFGSLADRQNWEACETIFGRLDPWERSHAQLIYHGRNIAETISEIATSENVPADRLWKLVGGLEKSFAQERGLI